MVHFRGLVLSLLFLLGGARRSMRINDSQQDAQKQYNSLTNGLDASAESKWVLIPAGLRAQVVRRAGPLAGRQQYEYGFKPDGQHVGRREAWSRLGPHRAKIALQAGSDPEEPAADEPAAPVAEATPAEAKPPRKKRGNKTPIEELEVGAELEGKIRSVMPYGAFVDVGASTDGLLHVSEISNEFIQDATEKLTVGDAITCKVKAINLEKQQLALTCKEPQARRKPRPDLSEYESADDKEFITGTVNSITDFGAFVTIKEGVDGLVHISQIQEGGVGKVEDVLSVGQEVQVRVTSVDKAKRRIGLSMREWTESSARNKRRGGGGGFGGDSFGEADKEFQMSADELEKLTVGDEFSSPFEAAFERAATVAKAKAEKTKYKAPLL